MATTSLGADPAPLATPAGQPNPPQGIHHQYQEPLAFRPERFMPGGEYEQFPEDIRPYYVSALGAGRCGI